MVSVTRMDLDGPTSPSALVAKILKAEPALSLPIPIDEIARQLDIVDSWEVEANEFSSLLLMPPPMWRTAMAAYRDPDLGQIAELARLFGVSRDAAARTFATYHDQLVAVVLVKDGLLQRVYRDSSRFPA